LPAGYLDDKRPRPAGESAGGCAPKGIRAILPETRVPRQLALRRDIPRYGLRARLHMELIGDGFAAGQPVTVHDRLTKIQFTLENRVKAAHKAQLCINGLAAGEYRFTVDSQSQTVRMPGDAADHWLDLPVGAGATAKVTIEKAS
jgi:hypothetical protein